MDIVKIDKEFWISIAKNDYKIPEGYTLEELTKVLFGYLGSTDPELRDDIAYIVYANFLKREMYSKEDIQEHVNELIANLEKGIGETESDSVFLRTFSILLLAEIVYRDNKSPMLDEEQIRLLLEKGLWYLDAEKDPRGHIPIKGWAHALAHTADLLLVLANNRFTTLPDHENILDAIAKKLVNSTNWTYIHGEDERLANAVTAVLERNLITQEFLTNWLQSLTEPEKSWKGAYTNEGQDKAYHNVRNFLRSISGAVRKAEDLPQKDEIQNAVFQALDSLRPY